MLEAIPWRTITHYGLHFVAPLLLAMFFRKDRRWKAYLIMLCTMIIDADHLLADPLFDPNRMSIGFHPLHTYYAIAVYAILCVIPYERLHWPWWLRAVGVGLMFHMFTDWQDYALWM